MTGDTAPFWCITCTAKFKTLEELQKHVCAARGKPAYGAYAPKRRPSRHGLPHKR